MKIIAWQMVNWTETNKSKLFYIVAARFTILVDHCSGKFRNRRILPCNNYLNYKIRTPFKAISNKE